MATTRSPRTAAGRVPEIHLEGETVAFYIDIVGVRAGQQLVIRCEDNGEVTAAIVFRDRNAAQSPRRFRPAA